MKDFFENMNPYFDLSDIEIDMLATIYSRENKEITTSTKDYLMKEFNMNRKQLNKALKTLEDKGTIYDNKIIKNYKFDSTK